MYDWDVGKSCMNLGNERGIFRQPGLLEARDRTYLRNRIRSDQKSSPW